MTQPPKTAVIGLGTLGFGVAKSCLAAGHVTHGIDIDEAKAERFVEAGGATDPIPHIAGILDAVVVVLRDAAQCEQALFGPNGLARLLRPGAVVIGGATVPPSFARHMEARCRAQGVHYLDAPISGREAEADAATLTIMASGTAEAFEAAAPVLDAMAEKVFRLGDAAGAGSAMKAINQLLSGVHIAAMAEALTFGMTQGIDPGAFVSVISECSGTSAMLEACAPHVVDGDYTPISPVNIWPKDLGIVLDIAREAEFSAPVAAAALQQFLIAANMGLGDEDDAALAKVYARNAGLDLPQAN